MLIRCSSLLSVALASALAVACTQTSEHAGRAIASPEGKQVTAPAKPATAAPQGKVRRPLPNWGRYWLT
jgi:hypothetical protein